MRVTHSATYRKFNSSINSVHSKLNKSMNKISSGKAYENAAENPLAYFEGKKMDNQYQDVETKLELISDIKNRLYQQEAGARSIQQTLSAGQLKVEYIVNDTNNELEANLDIIQNDLIQKMNTMVNDLNAQYQDFFIYGGNDISTAPFTLNVNEEASEITLTYNHVFPGEDSVTTIKMQLKKENGEFKFDYSGTDAEGQTLSQDDSLNKLIKAMSEQGRVDVGYGTIRDTITLMDTYTGGLNLLTGISSDEIIAAKENPNFNTDVIAERLLNSPLGLLGQAVCTLEDYKQDNIPKSEFSDTMRSIMDEMTISAHYVSTVYSDLGNKYSQLETTETKLNLISDSLEEMYFEKLGADPYEAITEMYSHQYAYNASLQLGSSLMSTSLFDFMR